MEKWKKYTSVLNHSSQTVHQGTLGCHSKSTGGTVGHFKFEIFNICWLLREPLSHSFTIRLHDIPSIMLSLRKVFSGCYDKKQMQVNVEQEMRVFAFQSD